MYRVNHYPPPRPPRRPWVPLAIIAGGMVVSLIGGASYAAYRFGLKRATASGHVDVSASASSAVAPASTPMPEAPSEPVAGAGAGEEDGPATPGTPGASLRARPAWGDLEPLIRGEATQKWAPQHSKPLDVFLKATTFGGNVDHAFVICRVQSFNKADSFAGDDLHVRATFGSAPEVANDGPEDANLGFVSAPLISLRPRDTLHFVVFDRDALSLELITRTSVPFTGAPVVTADSGAAIECRQLQGDALAHAVANQLAAADSSIRTLGKSVFTGAGSDWGYPVAPIGSAYRATGDVAALVGWADPRVKKRVAALADAVSKIEAQRAAVFTSLHDGAPDRVTFSGLEAQAGEVKCSGEACEVRLRVTNKGSTPLRFGNFMESSVYVATSKSGPVATTLLQIDIAPGATSEVIARSYGPLLASEPAIAGICVAEGQFFAQRCLPIKLR